MAPKKCQKGAVKVGSSQDQGYDGDRFISVTTLTRYNSSMCSRKVIPERGFANPNEYFQRILDQNGWVTFGSHPPAGVLRVVREFYANVLLPRDDTCFVRGKWVPFDPQTINDFYALPTVDETRFENLRAHIDWVEICKELTDGQAHWNTTRKGELTWFPSSLLTLSAKIWFYFVITRICPNLNSSEVTKEKALYVYAISRDIPFDIGRVISEDILERPKRPSNTALGFPSLITQLCMLNEVHIAGYEDKSPHPWPLSVKAIKTRPRKSVRGGASGSGSGHGSGSGRPESNEEEEGEDHEEEGAMEEEEEEAHAMPPLGHQGKLILQSVDTMFNVHALALHARMDKQDAWHTQMYESLATATSSLAHRQDMLWENVANLESSMRELLAHPDMQLPQDAVPPSTFCELPPWEHPPVIPQPYPPTQGYDCHDTPNAGEKMS